MTATASYEKTEVMAAAKPRWREILVNVAGIDPTILAGDNQEHPCPKCGGNTRFRCVDTATGGCYCSHCLTTGGGEVCAVVAWMLDISLNEVYNRVGEYLALTPRETPARDLWTEVYSELLSLFHLAEPHRKHLLQRGLSEEEIGRRGYRSIPASKGQRDSRLKLLLAQFGDAIYEVPGIKKAGDNGSTTPTLAAAAGLGIPSRDATGQIQAIRVRRNEPGKRGKYYYLSSGKGNGPSPGAPIHVPLGVTSGNVVRVTEGELKADVAFLLSGLPTISIPGVAAYKKLPGVLKTLDAKTALLSFDADCLTKAGVAMSLKGCVKLLRAEGFEVQIERWDAGHGKGVDDVLRAGHSTEILHGDAVDDFIDGLPDPKQGPKQQSDDPLSIVFPEGKTDLANSRRFARRFANELRFCKPWGEWLFWDGHRWRVDEISYAQLLAKSISDDLWSEARNCGLSEPDKELKFAADSAKARSINATLTLAASELPIVPADLDRDHWLLNCPNGTLDLRTGRLRNHDPDDRITKLCPTDYVPAAACPEWERFLRSILPDPEVVEFVQRFAGYCLTGDVREQILPIFWGSGSNGKSTFLNTLMAVLGGDYCMQAPREFLMARRGEQHPTELADLFGRRFVSCVETEDGRRLAESTVKQLTGGERIRARRMRENFWEFDPTHKVILCTNHKPEVRGEDHAIWRRLALVEFGVKFWKPDEDEAGPPELRCDKLMPKRLKQERPGILRWAVQGCVAWQRHGLEMPEAVRKSTRSYRDEQDIVAAFIDECCELGSAFEVRASALYAVYKEWAGDQKEFILSRKKLGGRMTDRGFLRKKSSGIWYLGIKLKENSEGQSTGPS